MLAYLNDPTLKADLLAEMATHREADAIVQGTYGDETAHAFKGCAVGCAVHSLNRRRGLRMSTGDHGALAAAIGVPEHLPRLFDTIFEGLPKTDAVHWPERVLSAMKVGADYSNAHIDFLIAIQERNCARLGPEFKEQIDAIQRATEVLRNWRAGALDVSAARSAAWWARSAAESARSAAESAWSAAWSAAESAESAAGSAAWSARSAARSAADSAESAAWSAARSAESAAGSAAWSARSAADSADSAESAAWSAAESAESAAGSAAWSARSAADSAKDAEYQCIADTLVAILEAAP